MKKETKIIPTRDERIEIVMLLRHFLGEKVQKKEIIKLLHELGYRYLKGRKISNCFLNKIKDNPNAFINNDSLDEESGIVFSKGDNEIRVTSNGSYVVRNNESETVLFRSNGLKEASRFLCGETRAVI